MKRYLVIGNPIEHSLSPKLHNYWLKKNNIDAIYDKKKIDEKDLQSIISQVKEGKINGINVTVPFKKAVISYLDELSPEAKVTQSVNTICLQNGNTIGHNTDIVGFELAIKYAKYDISNKKVFILGAGGVAPSIIYSLQKLKALKIILSNRTKKKAENLKILFKDIEIVDWGKNVDFDMIINATSIGLSDEDEIKIDFSSSSPNKFFYDVIYNPIETVFLKKAKLLRNKVENGKKMFIYQAAASFKLWHGIEPKINEEVSNILEK